MLAAKRADGLLVLFRRINMVKFMSYPAVQSVEKGTTLYADVVNHCLKYKEYLVGDSKPTSAHEITHCINSDIRNAHTTGYKEKIIHKTRTNYKGDAIRVPTALRKRVPVRPGKSISSRVNAFYLGKDRAIVIPEPKISKAEVAQYVPNELRASRFGLYITGQTEWNDSPLYVFDEAVAYTNGAWTAYDLIQAGEKVDKSRIVDGHVEFIAYCTAVMMAADKANDLPSLLTDFSKWFFTHTLNVYFLGKGVFPAFEEQDKLYYSLVNNKDICSFLKSKLGYILPDRPQPENTDKLSPDDFKLV